MATLRRSVFEHDARVGAFSAFSEACGSLRCSHSPLLMVYKFLLCSVRGGASQQHGVQYQKSISGAQHVSIHMRTCGRYR